MLVICELVVVKMKYEYCLLQKLKHCFALKFTRLRRILLVAVFSVIIYYLVGFLTLMRVSQKKKKKFFKLASILALACNGKGFTFAVIVFFCFVFFHLLFLLVAVSGQTAKSL